MQINTKELLLDPPRGRVGYPPPSLSPLRALLGGLRRQEIEHDFVLLTLILAISHPDKESFAVDDSLGFEGFEVEGLGCGP